MKKKSIMLILLITMLFVLLIGAPALAETVDSGTFSVGSATVLQDEGTAEVEIPVSYEGSALVTALQVEVSFDNGIEFVKYTKGDVLEGITEPVAGTNPVVMPFVDFTLQGTEIKTGAFAVLNLRVPLKKTTEYTIDIKVSEASDEKFESIATQFNCVAGKIVVENNPEVLDEDEMKITSAERAKDAVVMKIDTSLACTFGKMIPIDSENAKVVPYIYNERTLVPLRFVSETLGAEVVWEEGWNYCLINKEGKQIKITFNSADIEVDGKTVTYEAPVQVVEGRTMVPIRFISEELGYHVHWNAPNKMVVITPADNPWVAEREAENTLIREVVVTLFLKGSF